LPGGRFSTPGTLEARTHPPARETGSHDDVRKEGAHGETRGSPVKPSKRATAAAHRRADAHAFYEALGYEHTGRRYAKQLR
jgi:hypothetical protein